MKKRRKKCGYALLILLAVVAICGGYWAWKYYGLPEWLDDKECKTIEERAEKALQFARRYNMNEHYALFLDYSIPSGTPRLFVWDFHKKKIIVSTYVMLMKDCQVLLVPRKKVVTTGFGALLLRLLDILDMLYIGSIDCNDFMIWQRVS